ncbi:MAG: NAD(P)H-dependent oxidoreductase [Cyclobacteriaceae bacterium]|nr:NAD(P)H-dependent oxidoreductase [Cyclobacteriaceae bacterium]
MNNIAIISASVRPGRVSHRVALYFKNLIEEKKLGTVTMLDLAEYDFPVFHERLRLLDSPSAEAIDFAEKIKKADGVIIVTPEYNGGYPASLKNVIDLLSEEWRKKPVAISTVSTGVFGGVGAIIPLQYTLWKIQTITATAMFPVPKIKEAFNELGVPADKPATDERATRFLNELGWCMEAKRRMNS